MKLENIDKSLKLIEAREAIYDKLSELQETNLVDISDGAKRVLRFYLNKADSPSTPDDPVESLGLKLDKAAREFKRHAVGLHQEMIAKVEKEIESL